VGTIVDLAVLDQKGNGTSHVAFHSLAHRRKRK
jgi:hypothetical protein